MLASSTLVIATVGTAGTMRQTPVVDGLPATTPITALFLEDGGTRRVDSVWPGSIVRRHVTVTVGREPVVGWDAVVLPAASLHDRSLLVRHAGSSGQRWAIWFDDETGARLDHTASVRLLLGAIEHPDYLRIDGEPVVVVVAEGDDPGREAWRWNRIFARHDLSVHLVLLTERGAASELGGGVDSTIVRPHLEAMGETADALSWRRSPPGTAELTGRLWGMGFGTILTPDTMVIPPPPRTGAAVRVVAAGDISCSPRDRTAEHRCRHRETARVAQELEPDVVIPLGDVQYGSWWPDAYRVEYEGSWGSLLDRTRPVIGNHDLVGTSGGPYFDYFGWRSGSRGTAFYSFEGGGWHIVALDTNCGLDDRCARGSPQLRWLEGELEASNQACTLVVGHHPRFSAGLHGSDPSLDPIFEVLARYDVELYLSGHDHHYERRQAVGASGAPDPGGVRQFVVGTGGEELRPGTVVADKATEVWLDDEFGVLALDLGPDAYNWHFVTVDGRVADSGSDRCHP